MSHDDRHEFDLRAALVQGIQDLLVAFRAVVAGIRPDLAALAVGQKHQGHARFRFAVASPARTASGAKTPAAAATPHCFRKPRRLKP